MPTRDFNFLLFESCYKRRFNVTENATVELPEEFTRANHSDKLQIIFEKLADGTITPEQAQTLITSVKTAADIDVIPALEDRLWELEDKLKD